MPIEWIDLKDAVPPSNTLCLFCLCNDDGGVSANIGRWNAESKWARCGYGSYFYYPETRDEVYWASFNWPDGKA